MLRRHPAGWIDQWFDVGDDVRRVDALSELCPCAEVTEQRPLTFDLSLAANLTRPSRPSLLNANALLVCGLFQSWKYAAAVGDELRRRLRWKQNITSSVSRFGNARS